MTVNQSPSSFSTPRQRKILRKSYFWLKLLIITVGLITTVDLVCRFLGEWFWFQEVDYLGVWLTRLLTQISLATSVFAVSALFLGLNLFLAEKLSGFESSNYGKSYAQKKPILGKMTLRPLLTLMGLICLLISFLLLHYLQISLSFLSSILEIPFLTNLYTASDVTESYDVSNLKPFFISSLKLQDIQNLLQQIWQAKWQIPILIGFCGFLMMKRRLGLKLFAGVISVFLGLVCALNWEQLLLFLNAISFEKTDPIFSKDVGFYVFSLPIWELLDFWVGGLFLYGLCAVSLIYLGSNNSISNGQFLGFSYPQLRHLYGLGGLVLLTLSLRHALARYELLYSERGVIYGASYADAQVQLPVETFLSITAAIAGIWLFAHALIHPNRFQISGRSPWVALIIYALGLLLGVGLTPLVQQFEVLPNELEKERPYLERSITMTRAGFALDRIEEEPFDPQGDLTLADIEANDQTIRNIRLWDTRPILQTNRQLQRIRLYYEFPDADIDRYTLLKGIGDLENPNQLTERQQVIISPRELNFSAIPQQGQTWVNRHLVYTHGYGFTLSPVNQVGEGGLPYYYIQDIGTGEEEEAGKLRTANPQIRDSIPIGNPRIYYGELTQDYVMTRTGQLELDFPRGDENAYNVYGGEGGINIGSWWRRGLFAEYLKDWQMLFTQNFTTETTLLMRRNIKERVSAIAPFLGFDRDPYLVTAHTEDSLAGTSESHLYWILDAYTMNDHYPYSDPGGYGFNYIRNSVKVIIDAYDGDIQFYIADDDPIIHAWDKVFPDLFHSLEEMPITLRSHIRYPVDLFKVQSERLLNYHMTDPQVFYNREDQWEIPREIYGTQAQAVEPYYLTMKLPDAEREEFILLLPFTPPDRNNMIAWLAARSDGEFYGRQLLYQFPKQRLIFGPEQIEALINQDPVISQQISLWNRQGSQTIQGNLLVIPIEESLLYVEPVYLEAARTSLPTLIRVIVVYENRIAMAETLQEAINVIFQPEKAEDVPAILRPLEDETTPVPEELELE
ncbi:hypothetical protein FRE64_02415 [Euhalothece natronophila Z-M001]|uniref:UPF0182 protein FRE64_02415 n=1 Tax=Euhalothece natronophila Z-M001 TaxID=522448 RepID=A0A5B8NI63_9CHRO|nr:UPF0182 family protein [Euhalothece natronophila]QDZ38892.1 hypothetical protein FRE64_02415 [Euhalothece natronophila Z-M001]